MTTFLKDDFTGDGNISAHSVTGTGAVGGAWVSHPASSGELAIVGGFLQSGGNNNRFAYNDIDPGADDYSVTVTIGNNEGIVGPRVRHDTTTNTCYEAVHYLSPQQILLFRYVNGSPTQLAAWSGHPGCSSLRLEVSGTGAAVNIKVYKDGSTTALTPAGYDDTDASRIVTRGRPAVRVYAVSSPNAGPTAIEGANALAAVATTITLSGPTSGVTGVASSDFTATADQPVSVDTTIATATDGTGTFSPASPVIIAGSSSVTFTYTPGADEAASISISNDAGLAVSHSITYTSSSANTAPTFSGTIANISATAGSAIAAVDVSSLFSDAESGLTFSPVGSWPAGVTVSSSGVISGTPAAAGTFGSLQVSATDSGGLTATSNLFTLTASAAAAGSIALADIRNRAHSLLASHSLEAVYLIDLTAGTLDVRSALALDGSGGLALGGLVAGREYVVTLDDGAGALLAVRRTAA